MPALVYLYFYSHFCLALHILVAEGWVRNMHNLKCAAKLIGLTILAFGLGLLLSFFLPDGFLVVIEAVVIIGIGFLFFSTK